MPNRQKRHKDDSHDDSGPPSTSSSTVRIAFYDTTPYFREYFHRVADDEKAEVRFKWCHSHTLDTHSDTCSRSRADPCCACLSLLVDG